MSIQTLLTGSKRGGTSVNTKTYFNNEGFTLVELLLVIALLVFSVGLTGDILITLTRSYSKSQVQTEIEQNSNFVSLKLEKELRNAQSVVTGVSTFTHLAFVDNSGLNIICYDLTSNAIRRSIVAIASGDCTSGYQQLTSADINGGVSVSCGDSGHCFEIQQAPGGPFIVKIHFEFIQAYSGTRKELTGGTSYDNVIVVRGSY